MASLLQALLLDKGAVVSLVGAGGKTTLMFRLARELAAAGESVLTTTTTKIFYPSPQQSDCVIIAASAEGILQQAERFAASHLHMTAAAANPSGKNKLVGFTPETVDVIRHSALFRWILVEADGAARKSLKAPAMHEPVIPACTTRLVGVVGLSALGKPLTEQWVHRPEIFAHITGLRRGRAITEAAVCELLVSGRGIFKGAPEGALRFVFLNQADLPETRSAGHRIAECLVQRKPDGLKRVVVGCARGEPAVVEWIDADSRSGLL